MARRESIYISPNMESRDAFNTSNLASPAGWLMDALAFGARTFTAKSVTPQRAIQVTPVWSSLSVRSRMASRMSLNVDRVDRQGAHTEARNTIPWNLLTQRASKFTTPTQLIRGIMWDLDLFGNAVLWKEKDPSTGRLIGSRYLQGRRLQIKIIDDEKHIIMDGKRDFTSKDVIHFFGTSMDGFRGLSPIKENKNVIAVAMRSEARRVGKECRSRWS